MRRTSLLAVALSIVLWTGLLQVSSLGLQPPRIQVSVRDCSAISEKDPRLAPLSAVCESVKSMEHALPNFVCQQTTQQYSPIDTVIRRSEERLPDDRISNIVTATVTHEDGVDRYDNLKVGNKLVQQDLSDVIGPIAIGDFGSELLSVFQTENGAIFKLQEQDSAEYVFNFQIPAVRNNAFTLLESESQTRPDLEGTIWVNKISGDVSRLDIVVNHIDPRFSTDHIRFSSLFGKVHFGDTKEFFLPQQAESTVCDRERLCAHNVTRWGTCKRLSAKTRIIFGSIDASQPQESAVPSPSEPVLRPQETKIAVTSYQPQPNHPVEDSSAVAMQTKLPHPADPPANAETLQTFIEQYPDSVAKGKTFDQLLAESQGEEKRAALMKSASRSLKENSNNLAALAVLVYETDAQAKTASTPQENARLRRESSQLATRGLGIISSGGGLPHVPNEGNDRFLSTVKTIFYFALAAPIEQ